MDISRMAHAATSIAGDDRPLLILLPARALIARLLLFFAVWTLLLTLTYSLLAFITIPVLAFWSYLYYFFCLLWRKYRLSRLYTVGLPCLSVVASVAARYIWYIL